MGGKSIRIFFVDGSSTGLRTAEFSLSTIKGVYVPRGMLQSFAKREEAKKTGVYILLGEDPEIPGRTKIYIGEADEVLTRLINHDKDPSKDFWNRAVVFVSKDQNLTKAHVRYLEAKLIDLANRVKRCTVHNQTTPAGGNLPEADVADMEEFIEQVKLLLATMGIDALDEASPKPISSSAIGEKKTLTLYMEGEDYKAECVVVNGEFVVQKGSTARKIEVPSLGKSSKAKRAELLSSGVLQEKDSYLLFVQDYAFSSASGAAQVICGANVNGRTSWKLKNGKTFAEWQDEQLKPTSQEDSGIDSDY